MQCYPVVLQLSKNHQETLDAITNLETQMHGQIASMAQHIDQQNQHIAKLESKLTNISKDVKFVKHKSLTEPKLIVEKQIVRVPVEEKKSILKSPTVKLS